MRHSVEHCSKRNATAQHQNKGIYIQCIHSVICLTDIICAWHYQNFVASPAFSIDVTASKPCMAISLMLATPSKIGNFLASFSPKLFLLGPQRLYYSSLNMCFYQHVKSQTCAVHTFRVKRLNIYKSYNVRTHRKTPFA